MPPFDPSKRIQISIEQLERACIPLQAVGDGLKDFFGDIDDIVGSDRDPRNRVLESQPPLRPHVPGDLFPELPSGVCELPR